MSAPSMVMSLLDAADMLLMEKPHSAAFRRRAVSTAYYAVFHALAKLCAECLLPNVARETGEYLRIYRGLDHGPVKNVFGQPPLNSYSSLRQIGDVVTRLQSERLRADYLPPEPKLLPLQEATELVKQARQVVGDLQALNDGDRRTLATCLLFKSR